MVFSLVFGALGLASVSNASVASVSAGTTQTITLPTSTVTLAGTAVPSVGSAIASYSWSQTSGPVVTSIANPSLASTVVSGFTTPGTYVFALTVSDNTTPTALTLVSNVSVVVNPVSAVMVAAGSNQTLVTPTSTTTLTGTAATSTVGASLASYAWTQIGGPVTASIATPSLAQTTVSGLTAVGDYTFKLTATDTASVSGYQTVTVRVASSTVTPKKIKTQLEINSKGSVNLSGELVSNSNGVLTVKVWGITFTVLTANTKIGTGALPISSYVVGDVIRVNGTLNATASTPTITARSVSDLTRISVNKIKKHDDDRLKNIFKGIKKGNDKKGKGDH